MEANTKKLVTWGLGGLAVGALLFVLVAMSKKKKPAPATSTTTPAGTTPKVQRSNTETVQQPTQTTEPGNGGTTAEELTAPPAPTGEVPPIFPAPTT